MFCAWNVDQSMFHVVAFEFCDWAEERAFPGKKGWAQQILPGAGMNRILYIRYTNSAG